MRTRDRFVAVLLSFLAAGCLRPAPLAPQTPAPPTPPPKPPSGYLAQVAATVRLHKPEVEGCFERARTHEMIVNGRLLLHWTVDNGGHVAALLIRESTLSDRDLSACIARAVAGWRFPPPAGRPSEIDYTFIFE